MWEFNWTAARGIISMIVKQATVGHCTKLLRRMGSDNPHNRTETTWPDLVLVRRKETLWNGIVKPRAKHLRKDHLTVVVLCDASLKQIRRLDQRRKTCSDMELTTACKRSFRPTADRCVRELQLEVSLISALLTMRCCQRALSFS